MPTAPRIVSVVLGSEAPRLDPSSGDGTNDLLSRLKGNNHALDNLRRALEGDETLEEARAAKPAHAS